MKLTTLALFGFAHGKMDCGNVAVCGVLTLETGLGPGNYHHNGPAVHGLWPEVGSYGTSKCVAPSGSKANPTKVYPCYTGNSSSFQLSFEAHEWGKHGSCAGVKDADDFFSQICGLASAPIKTMVASGTTLDNQVAELKVAGYEVFSIDKVDSQVQLSACLNSKTGKWVLGKVADFSSICGGSGPAPGPSPGPVPPGPTPSGYCAPNQHGPKCKSDAECIHIPSCVRCAKSGYCTNQPKALLQMHFNTTV